MTSYFRITFEIDKGMSLVIYNEKEVSMIIHGVACGHCLIEKAPELEFGGTEEHSCFYF